MPDFKHSRANLAENEFYMTGCRLLHYSFFFRQAPEEFFYATLVRVNQTLAETTGVVQQGPGCGQTPVA